MTEQIVLGARDRALIKSVADAMAEANPQWGTVRGAAGECGLAATRFALLIHDKLPCVDRVNAIASRPGVSHGRFSDHWAAVVGDTVIDLTARQFEPLLPFPWITDLDTWARELGFYFGCEMCLMFDSDERDEDGCVPSEWSLKLLTER